MSSRPTPTPYPTTVSTPPSFDRSWDAALGAAADAGVQIGTPTAAPAASPEQGRRGRDHRLRQQADNSLKVSFDAPDSKESNPTLGDRWLAAYQRRMGR